MRSKTIILFLIIIGEFCRPTSNEKNKQVPNLKSIAKACSYNCTQDHVIKKPEIKISPTSSFLVDSQILSLPHKIPAWYQRIMKYWSYDYKGTVLDTQGWSATETIPLSKEEVIETAPKLTCLIGETCPPLGDCRGSKANELYNNNERNKPTGPRGFKHQNQKFTIFAYHTLVTDWQCEVFKIDLEPYYKGNWASHTIEVFHTDHQWKELREKEVFGVTKEKFSYFIKKPEPISSTGKLNCLQGETSVIMCNIIESSDPRIAGTILELEADSCTAKSKGIMAYIPECWKKINKRAQGSFLTEIEVRETMDNAAQEGASIADVRKVVDMILYNEFQSISNNALLMREIRDLSALTRKLVLFALRKDDIFTQSLFGGPFKATFVTPTRFKLCPCTGPSGSGEEEKVSCRGMYHFDGSNWIMNSEEYSCGDKEAGKPLEIELLKMQDLDYNMMNFPDITGSLMDHNDVYNSKMEKMDWEENKGRGPESTSFILNPFDSMRKWLSDFLSGITELVAFMSLFISLYLLYKLKCN